VLSRREVLMMAPLSVAALRQAGRNPSGAAQPSTTVSFEVPAGACDCHTHVFGDPTRFPFAPNRTYTPQSASVEEMRKLHRALHTSRVVIVQPSVYGTDNACTLDGVKQLSPNARGIAVIDDQTTDGMLDQMNEAGIRGIRINLATVGQTDPELGKRRFEATIGRIGKRKWHVQIYTQLSVIEAMRTSPNRRCRSSSITLAERRRQLADRSAASMCCWISCDPAAPTSRSLRLTVGLPPRRISATWARSPRR
jgi:amidohydrolase family protein